MRNSNWLIALAIAATTTGCVETMNSGYPSGSYGYGDGYSSGYSGGYYAQPAPTYYSNNYYSSPTRVVTQTRYVPVPTPAPQRHADRSNDHRWQGSHDDQHRGGTPAASHHNPEPRQPSANNSNNNHHRGNQDRDGDGRPDRRS